MSMGLCPKRASRAREPRYESSCPCYYSQIEGLGLPGPCSSRARWALAPNFCSWATRKSQIFHTNHMLGTPDFTGTEH